MSAVELRGSVSCIPPQGPNPTPAYTNTRKALPMGLLGRYPQGLTPSRLGLGLELGLGY